ncbi:MAG: hypothetical protein ACLFR2_07020 [Candidatus Kapaibacterium sp.]
MKSNIKFHIILWTVIAPILVLGTGCIEESDSLVNPPPQAESVLVRFMNLAEDSKPRKLDFEAKAQTELSSFGQITPVINPPADSAFMSVVTSDGEGQLRTQQRHRFARNLTYTYFAMPAAGLKDGGNADSLIRISTSSTIPDNSTSAYIRLLNANPDTTIRYTLRLGCPNGEVLVGNLEYLNNSLLTPVRTGDLPVSLIRETDDGPEPIGLYKLEQLDRRGQYTIIIINEPQADEKVMLLDEKIHSEAAVYEPPIIEERTTEIRTINFSTETVTLKKNPDETVVQALGPGMIQNYTEVSACGTDALDTLSTLLMTGKAGALDFSLEVLEKYNTLIFDTEEQKAGGIVVVNPLRLYKPSDSTCVIRVVHGAYGAGSRRISLGARNNDTARNNYTSGIVITSEISPGEVSAPAIIKSGYAPLTLFANTQPQRLVNVATGVLEPNKNYLLVINYDQQGNERLTLIEDDPGITSHQPLETGVIAQIVQVVSNKDFEELTIKNSGDVLIENAKVHFSGTIATILPEGTNTISTEDKELQFEAVSGERMLVVITGEKGETDIFTNSHKPFDLQNSYYIRRFLNASTESGPIAIKLADSEDILVNNVEYKEFTIPEKIHREYKHSFVFIEAGREESLIRIDDILLPLGKGYTLIFAGTKRYGYAVIFLQEF